MENQLFNVEFILHLLYILCHMITFGLAEDNEYHSGLVKKALKNFKLENKLLFDAENGYELLNKLNGCKQLPNILLLDIEMPKIDGLIATTYISKKYPTIKIMGISGHCNEPLVSEVLSEGATSFITKHFTVNDSVIAQMVYKFNDIFLEAVTDTLANKQYIDIMLYNKKGNIRISKSTQSIIKEKFPNLSHIHIEFLTLNAADLSFEEIAKLMNKSIASVKAYNERLCEAFNVANRAELSKFCAKHGIIKVATYYDKYIS